jgi:ribonuclease D
MSRVSRTTPGPRLVERADDLQGLCAEIAGEPYYALDTEFHTERTYYPKLALIQLAWAATWPWSIRWPSIPARWPRSSRDRASPWPTRPSRTSTSSRRPAGPCRRPCSTPRSWLASWGSPPRRSAAWSIRCSGLRSPRPTSCRTGCSARSQTARSPTPPETWPTSSSSGPLISEQLEELGPPHLGPRGVRPGAQGPARAVTVPEELWWKMGDVRKLTGRSRGVAQEMAAWRDRRAAVDRPRRSVLSDLALLAIAQRPPKSRQELQQTRGVDGRHLAQGGAAEILAADTAGARPGAGRHPAAARRPGGPGTTGRGGGVFGARAPDRRRPPLRSGTAGHPGRHRQPVVRRAQPAGRRLAQHHRRRPDSPADGGRGGGGVPARSFTRPHPASVPPSQ